MAERPLLTATEDEPGGKAALTLNRLGEEHMVAEVEFTAESEGPWENSVWGFTSLPTPGAEYPLEDLSGLYWIGDQGRSAYMGYFGEDRSCACSSGDPEFWDITADEPVRAAAVLPAPPEDTEQVTVASPFSLPFTDVPIGSEEVDLDSYGITPPGSGAEAEVWPLVGESAAADGSEETREKPDYTDVELSADVLFDLNESTLTEDAEKVLDGAAERIQASGAEEIRVAGHTDDSGDDAINGPLSEERAETVATALGERTGTGVDYGTEGHGSAEPIADNSTEEGAQRNRRVTVTIPAGKSPPAEQSGDRSAPEEDAPEEGQPFTEFSASLTDPDDDTYQAELAGAGLQRVAPDTVLLSYEMANTSDGGEALSPFWAPSGSTALASLDGTEATDPATGRTYRSMVLDQSAEAAEGAYSTFCACTVTSAGSSAFVGAGQSTTLFTLLPIPDEVSVIDVNLGEAANFKGAAVED
ncbi:OmpA family protein [Nocardiopsis coralliicola]